MNFKRNCAHCKIPFKQGQTKRSIPIALNIKRAACGLSVLHKETVVCGTCLLNLYNQVHAAAPNRPTTRAMDIVNIPGQPRKRKTDVEKLGVPEAPQGKKHAVTAASDKENAAPT
ncbi:TPA: hypothetical protein ACH3X2_009400 [Trebouxia sp. C0005]